MYTTHNQLALREIAVTREQEVCRETATGNCTVYTMVSDGPVGLGSSCALYLGRAANGSGGIVRLKQCRSRRVEDEQRFLRTVHLQYRLLENADTANGVAVLFGAARGEDGHLWTIHTCDTGESYDRVRETDIHQTLRHIRYLTEAVAQLHDAGFCLLDLKPANLFLLKSGLGKEGVSLVDCDSFLTAEEIAQGDPLSTSEHYGAPEVLARSRRLIDHRADLYSIGLILFEKVMGRLPNIATELCGSAVDLCADGPEGLTRRLTVPARRALEELFARTLCPAPGERYGSARELLSALDILIRLTDPNLDDLPRLNRQVIDLPADFVPRPALMRRIREGFSHSRAVALVGPWGVGKTEAARQFAHDSREEYDGLCMTVVRRCSCNDIIQDLDLLNIQEPRQRRDCVAALGETHLIILDNCDIDQPEELQELQRFLENTGNARILITTRRQTVGSLPGVTAIPLDSSRLLGMTVFRQICTQLFTSEELLMLEQLLEPLGFHTYACAMIARELTEYGLPLELFARRCREKGLLRAEPDGAEIRSDKDRRFTEASIREHLLLLFSDVLSHPFTDDAHQAEHNLMVFLTRSPAMYFDRDTVCQLVGDDLWHRRAMKAAKLLTDRGWLRSRTVDGKVQVSVHPLAAEALRGAGVIQDSMSHVTLFCRNLLTMLDAPYFEHLYYCAVDNRFPGLLPFDHDNLLVFSRKLDMVLNHRSLGFGVPEEWQLKEHLTGTAVFGASQQDGMVDYWVYLSQPNATFRFLRLRRGYTVTEDDLSGDMLFFREREPLPGEESRILKVCPLREPEERFDLAAMSAAPVAARPILPQEVIVSYRGEEEDCSAIPHTGGFQAEKVTAIAPYAFHNSRQWLREIVVPPTVTAIGERAFFHCATAEQIRLPEGLAHLGREAFALCSALRSAALPDQLKTLPPNLFSSCANLEQVTLPRGLRDIPAGCFTDCSSLRWFQRLPMGLQSIGAHAFQGCRSLRKIFIPSGVTRIGEAAFSRCGRLFRVDFPAGLEEVGPYAFLECGLLSLHLPAGLRAIGRRAFSGCAALEQVDFPTGCRLESIGTECFSDCTSLRQIALPDSVLELGEGLFSSCLALEEAALPTGLTALPPGIFRHCSSLAWPRLPRGLQSIGPEAFLFCGSLTMVELPESVTHIGEEAFRYCGCLFQAKLPKRMPNIGQNAFDRCWGEPVKENRFTALSEVPGLREMLQADRNAGQRALLMYCLPTLTELMHPILREDTNECIEKTLQRMGEEPLPAGPLVNWMLARMLSAAQSFSALKLDEAMRHVRHVSLPEERTEEDLLHAARRLCDEDPEVTASVLQRELGVGFRQAFRLMEQVREVSPHEEQADPESAFNQEMEQALRRAFRNLGQPGESPK